MLFLFFWKCFSVFWLYLKVFSGWLLVLRLGLYMRKTKKIVISSKMETLTHKKWKKWTRCPLSLSNVRCWWWCHSCALYSSGGGQVAFTVEYTDCAAYSPAGDSTRCRRPLVKRRPHEHGGRRTAATGTGHRAMSCRLGAEFGEVREKSGKWWKQYQSRYWTELTIRPKCGVSRPGKPLW